MTRIQDVFAQNMKHFRNTQHLSQAQLAERAHTIGNYIALIERGVKFPSPDMIERIADALRIDSTELFQPLEAQFTTPWSWGSVTQVTRNN